jgi:mono/diheme cytochrome c family protein
LRDVYYDVVRTFLLGLLVGLIIVPLCVWVYFRFGLAPVGTDAGAMPFEKYLAHADLNARMSKEAPKSSPLPATDTNYEGGAHVYRQHCAICHGLPGQPETFISRGEYPHPPQLFEGHGVTDDPGETYWKVANGIRLTGMPAFKKTLSEDEMWQVSLLLAYADKIPQNIHTELEAMLVTE